MAHVAGHGRDFTREEIERALPFNIAINRGAVPGSKSFSFLRARESASGIERVLEAGVTGTGVSYVGGTVGDPDSEKRAKLVQLIDTLRQAGDRVPDFDVLAAEVEARQQAAIERAGDRGGKLRSAFKLSSIAAYPDEAADVLLQLDDRFVAKQGTTNVINELKRELEPRVEGQPNVFARVFQAAVAPPKPKPKPSPRPAPSSPPAPTSTSSSSQPQGMLAGVGIAGAVGLVALAGGLGLLARRLT